MVNEDIKKSLKSICMSHGWCYGVFWRFDPHNHMMLTMEDAYCMEHAGSVIDSMLLQVHRLGEGVIGGAAVDGKHRWMSADAFSWDVSEFGLQFSSGIKTIAVLPVELRGVVQLGSIQEISETRELVDQVRNFLQETLGVVPGGNVCSSLISDAAGQYEVFASLDSSQSFFSGDVSTSWANTVEHVASSSSVFDLLDVQFGPYNEKAGDDNGDSELLVDSGSGSLIKNTEGFFEEQFRATDFAPPSIVEFQMDDLTQWLADSSKLCLTSLDVILSDDMPHTSGVSSVLSGNDDVFRIQGNSPACLLETSPSNALNVRGEAETSAVNKNNEPLLAEFGTVNVMGAMGHTHDVSEGVSEVGVHSAAAPRKGLFSELGLEHLLRDEKGASSSCSSKSWIDDQWPPSKRRRVEGYQMFNNHFQHTDLIWGENLMQPQFITGQIRDSEFLTRCKQKSQTGLCVGESYGMDAKSCISTIHSQSRKLDEPARPVKKRAKPGESKKPRPKDRQQIAERINELRDLIPNGAKLSIDGLLGRTIKHMDYWQNLTKHAEKIKQDHEPKLIGHGNDLVQKIGSRGATWAFEVGGSNIVCPIIVEDLGHPRQMLIEMLCEEREYFLEMADIVKGLGLTILKGVMEERNGKIWAQFTVEGKKGAERVHVFMCLMQIFEDGSSREAGTRIESEKVRLWGKYQQHGVPISI